MARFLHAVAAVAIVMAVASTHAAKEEEKEEIEIENDVLILTKHNFDQALKEHDHILVKFYAPWCGHCKAMAPAYDKAAETLAKSGISAKLAKVDVTQEKKLGERYEIQGFPTIKFFTKGGVKEYNGPRDTEGIVNWVKKRLGPAAEEITDLEHMEKLVTNNELLVVGLFKDLKGKEAKEFINAASEDDEQMYVITKEKKIFDKYDIESDSAVIMLTKFDDGRQDFDGKIKQKDINKWAKENNLPLVNEFSPTTAAKIFGAEVKVHFLFLASQKNTKDLPKQLESLKTIAKTYKGKLIFVHVDVDVSDHANVLEFLGVKAKDCPTYLIFEMDKSHKYLAGNKKSIKSDDVTEFIDDFLDGKLTRTLKGEELPEDWDENPVKVLVSSNFREVALDKSKDVFVEFYAPWCGHCKQLTPIWEKLGDKFKDDESVVIAKMDSTANEVEEVTVKGFPTLKFFKKDTNEEIEYTGKRTLKALEKFVRSGGKTMEKDGDKPQHEEL